MKNQGKTVSFCFDYLIWEPNFQISRPVQLRNCRSPYELPSELQKIAKAWKSCRTRSPLRRYVGHFQNMTISSTKSAKFGKSKSRKSERAKGSEHSIELSQIFGVELNGLIFGQASWIACETYKETSPDEQSGGLGGNQQRQQVRAEGNAQGY